MENFEYEGVKWNPDKVQSDYNIACRKFNMRSLWLEASTIDEVVNKSLTEVDEYKDKKNMLLCNQVLITPNPGGCVGILGIIFGQRNLRVDTICKKMFKTKRIENMLRDNAEKAWNILIFDFVGQIPILMAFVISLNFEVNFELVKVVAKSEADSESVDVTERARKFVVRGRLLFLTDVEKDLALSSKSGYLTVCYRFNGGNVIVHEFEYDDSTEYLLS